MPGRCQARGAGDAGVTVGRYDLEDAAPAGGTMDLDRRKQGFGLARLLAAGVLSAVLAAAAVAQDYPQRVVTIIVPYPAGGTGDILPRAMADVLAQQTGQNFIVDNKPGATQTIGARLAVSAKPDGYTIFFGSVTSLAINPGVKKELPYDPVRDFEPISLTFVGGAGERSERPARQLYSECARRTLALNRARRRAPQYLLARRDLPANSVGELIELAKRMPGKLNYASIGPASSVHLAAELLKSMAGIDMTHVPYTGSGPAVRDTIAGHVDLTLTAGGMTYANQLKVLGVTSARRTSVAPQVPAIAETLPGYEATVWFGFLAPAGTPKQIVGRLAAEMKTAVASGALRERLKVAAADIELAASTPDEFRTHIQKEIPHWRNVIKAANIPLE
jgi:tripartite-type tricarboxylate transporter receptor subunit TctC